MVGGALVSPIKIKSGGGDYNIRFFENLKDVSKTINNENNFFIIDKYIYDNFELVNKKYEKKSCLASRPGRACRQPETSLRNATKKPCSLRSSGFSVLRISTKGPGPGKVNN